MQLVYSKHACIRMHVAVKYKIYGSLIPRQRLGAASVWARHRCGNSKYILVLPVNLSATPAARLPSFRVHSFVHQSPAQRTPQGSPPAVLFYSFHFWPIAHPPQVVEGGVPQAGSGGIAASGGAATGGATPCSSSSSSSGNTNLHREQRRLDDLVFQSGIRLAQSTRKATKVPLT